MSNKQKLNSLVKKLTKYGKVEVCNANHVFTLLITGKKLDNGLTVLDISNSINELMKEYFPIIETCKNDNHFYLLVLRKEKV